MSVKCVIMIAYMFKERDYSARDLDSEPTWGYSPPTESRFREEAPTVSQRSLALSCCLHILSQLDRSNQDLLRIDELEEICTVFVNRLKESWDPQEPPPFLTYRHLLGATKRYTAWLEELKVFQATQDFDKTITRGQEIQHLIEQVVKENRDLLVAS
jgi:hypothetical protein